MFPLCLFLFKNKKTNDLKKLESLKCEPLLRDIFNFRFKKEKTHKIFVICSPIISVVNLLNNINLTFININITYISIYYLNYSDNVFLPFFFYLNSFCYLIVVSLKNQLLNYKICGNFYVV
ncbi:hypothetical protein EDEG_04110 [Edhazardia aedis USNM 41457]|uniref:Uncharacterized protein n=1 Tax=Edhazardia aedis (strain USNM 41457) TaxID=1003232 RepID=J9DCI5_EDHAE|nr:hypothetical protein EDEG_04110 [Edhazardia aedis USNM 41457]|eukprot:EJW05174.1 hypothetical protein EDEG_04110 [Edhazardia aedis USNM 41457]